MKNKIKILFPVLLIIIIFVILIVVGIIPNPFLDTKDLVCTRESDFVTRTRTEKITISFNSRGNIEKIVEEYIRKYQSNEEAKQFYNSIIEDASDDVAITIENNTVTETREQTTFENFGGYEKNKKGLTKFYTDELYYNCE